MARALRFFLIVLATAFVAIAIPRESGRERALRRAWVTPIPARGRAATGAFAPGSALIVGEEFWALIDVDTGLSRAAGLRAGRFTGTRDWFINQPLEAPRWVVQGWDGNAVRIVENFGVPRFYDDLLVRFGERLLTVSLMPDGDPVTIDADVRMTAFDAGGQTGPDRYVAIGTARGGLAMYRHELGTLVEIGRRRIDSTISSTEPVYGIAITEVAIDEESPIPALVAVHGWDTQYLELLVPEEDGRLRLVSRAALPPQDRVSHPIEIVDLGRASIAAVFNRSVAVWDFASEQLRIYSITDATRIVGGAVGDDLIILAIDRPDGSAVTIAEGDLDRPFVWSMVGSQPLYADDRRVILQVDQELVAIEATL